MELPYQPISEAEAQELCQDLIDVVTSCSNDYKTLVRDIQASCGGGGAGSKAGGSRLGADWASDLPTVPDG